MATDILVGTDKPEYRTSGLVTITSAAAYDAAKPTLTAPSTTAQTFLVPSNLGDKPSLLRITPFCGSSVAPTALTFTAAGVRVVGWSIVTQASGVAAYVPAVLADLTLTLGSSVPTLTINTVAHYFFNTIAAGAGVPTVNLYSPGTASSSNDNSAAALIDTVGYQFITLQFKGTNANAPTMGAFYAFI